MTVKVITYYILYNRVILMVYNVYMYMYML